MDSLMHVYTPPLALLEGIADDLSTTSVVLRIGIAAVLGALIGLERKIADKPADVRTMMLICSGAATFIVLGQQIVADAGPEAITRVDTTRVLSYLISGIGFLGAGAILHSKKSIKGMTTASAIWAAAAIGAACGLAKFDSALTLTGLVVLVLWLPWLRGITAENGNGSHEDGDDRAVLG
ncbi:MAG: MgtC/SapB family protein [Phycisphaerales bacterium JB040]